MWLSPRLLELLLSPLSGRGGHAHLVAPQADRLEVWSLVVAD